MSDFKWQHFKKINIRLYKTFWIDTVLNNFSSKLKRLQDDSFLTLL